jgi:hypothetical protein
MAVALVIGGAECVWNDAKEALSMFTPDAVFVTNDMIAHWPTRLDYAVTLHPEKIVEWIRRRKIAGFSEPGEIWAHHMRSGQIVQRSTPDWGGSSGLFAVKIALEEGFDGIVLAGVPMVPEAKHFVRKSDWVAGHSFKKAWSNHLEAIKPKTRSMSGLTKELLGGPTAKWLLSIEAAPSDPDRVLT